MRNGRDLSLDYLRALGLLLIILAHVKPPRLLLHIRSFDVVLMVIVSTISYGCFSKKDKPYKEYVLGRFKRLVYPTWQFIILSAVLFGVCDLALGLPLHFTWKSIVIGFLTFSGIGYLWVIRVFLYNALLNPLLVRVRTLPAWKTYCLSACALALSYGALLVFRKFGLEAIAEISIINILSYGWIAALGYYFYTSSARSQKVQLSAYTIMTITTFGVLDGFVPNIYKYPPQYPYLIYGLTVSCLFLYFVRLVKIKYRSRLFVFISSNSFWIYFWHVILLNAFEFYSAYLTFYDDIHWGTKWIGITCVSCLLCYTQNFILKTIKNE